MKIVTPYRPFVPESLSHQRMPDFEWPAAIEMLRASAWESCQVETFVLTDCSTKGVGQAHRYVPERKRLMVWLLEVCLAYLESDDFDQDTAMLSPDMLVYSDLRPFFQADLGIVARLSPKFRESGRTLLFGAQFWRHAAKARLVDLYRRALAIADALPEHAQVWGADIEPFQRLISPSSYGTKTFGALSVHFFPEGDVMASTTARDEQRLQAGEAPVPEAPIVDFRYMRKLSMKAYFDATVGVAA